MASASVWIYPNMHMLPNRSELPSPTSQQSATMSAPYPFLMVTETQAGLAAVPT